METKILEEENRQSLGHLNNLNQGRGVPPSVIMDILLRGINRRLYSGQDLREAIAAYENNQSIIFLRELETGVAGAIEATVDQLAKQTSHQLPLATLLPDYMPHIQRGVQRGLFSQDKVDKVLVQYLVDSAQRDCN